MSFGAPQFLLLLPALALLGWAARSLELWRPLRALFLVLVVAALCEPLLPLKRGGMDLWVLLDRSLSAQDLVDRQEGEWRALLERSRSSREDRLFFIDYAAEVALSPSDGSARFEGRRDLTRTSLALRDVLARMEPTRHNRVLLFSDGYSTEPLGDTASLLAAAGAPLDYRLLRSGEETDYRVSALELPARVQPGEAFLVDVVVSGNRDGDVPATVLRGGEALFSRQVEVRRGSGRLRFQDRIAEPGSHRYEVRIAPEIDAHAGNNRAERWVEVVAGPRVLLFTKYEDDPLETVLRSQGFEVESVRETLSLDPGTLTGAKAAIFNNVPAHEFPSEFLSALPFFVAEQGGGLMMVGGKHSFGSGGYHQSALDPLLPVTMELKSEHRRLAVAMAIVMDRSGSMAMLTSSGHSKMALANEGAARAVELLSDRDAVAVYAVDTRPHQISPLLNVGTHRGELIRRIRGIQSMGGGIYVYTGLKEAWSELSKAEAGQRHIILFSDAADSEEPGQYRELLAEMREDGGSVSVIGLGSRNDVDGDFLVDIAERGSGRIFFTEVPEEVPSIFAQETVTLARSAFVEEPVPTQSTGRWHEIASRDLRWPTNADGYNLSYLRDGDESALVGADEYAAPLVAFGRRGIGRSAAVAFPLGGEHSESARAWEQYGDFVQTLARWLMGEELPAGLGLRHRLAGTRLEIDLLYDEALWGERFAAAPPGLALERDFRSDRIEAPVWERLAPGRYSASVEMHGSVPLRGAVKLGGSAIPFGPVTATTDAEWDFDPARIAELRETARASGGGELLDLTQAWRKPETPSDESLRTWFFGAAFVVLLLEALATRTGWRVPFPLPSARAARRREKEARPSARPRPAAATPATAADPSRAGAAPAPADSAAPAASRPKAPPDSPEKVPPPEDAAAARRRRFERAKKRR